jgi:hypothetical protein
MMKHPLDDQHGTGHPCADCRAETS